MVLCIPEGGLDQGLDPLLEMCAQIVGCRDLLQVSGHASTNVGSLKRLRNVPEFAYSHRKTRLTGSSGDYYPKCSTMSPYNQRPFEPTCNYLFDTDGAVSVPPVSRYHNLKPQSLKLAAIKFFVDPNVWLQEGRVKSKSSTSIFLALHYRGHQHSRPIF